MTSIPPSTTPLALDQDGHLADFGVWSPSVAQHFADQLNLELTAAHFEILEATRGFYSQYHYAPGMRPLIKYLRIQLERPSLDSLTLLALFPNSPARLIALLAGLPKPPHCL